MKRVNPVLNVPEKLNRSRVMGISMSGGCGSKGISISVDSEDTGGVPDSQFSPSDQLSLMPAPVQMSVANDGELIRIMEMQYLM